MPRPVRRIAGVALAALAVISSAAWASGPEIEKRSLVSGGKTRTYFFFARAAAQTGRPAPLIVTLHGSGRDGKSLVSKWKDLAEQEGIVLAGPDSTDFAHWATPADGPVLLRDLVEEVRRTQPIDPRRVYLFGHSAGALFALQMACLESEYFAAAAVHAGALAPSQFAVFDFAKRKIPIHIAIGDRDEFFSMADARATLDALKQRGFPAELIEMRRHTHDYYGSSGSINKSAWAFLSKQTLPANPQYTPYQDPR
jgi:poly(3-hydroxybutyrate) depolymerase